MIAILLPGLHGNGELFKPLSALLSDSCTCIEIDYPDKELLPYEDLVDLVKSKLPLKEDFFIIAESFGGPIAYLISLNPPSNLKFVVYGASFIDNPNKFLLYFRKVIPYIFKFSVSLPDRLFNIVLMKNMGTSDLIIRLKDILRGFPRALFRHRLDLLAKLSLPVKKTEVSAIYIRPLSDYLVTNAGYHSVSIRHKEVSRFEVKGTHFLFQSNPAECAKIILNKIKNF